MGTQQRACGHGELTRRAWCPAPGLMAAAQPAAAAPTAHGAQGREKTRKMEEEDQVLLGCFQNPRGCSPAPHRAMARITLTGRMLNRFHFSIIIITHPFYLFIFFPSKADFYQTSEACLKSKPGVRPPAALAGCGCDAQACWQAGPPGRAPCKCGIPCSCAAGLATPARAVPVFFSSAAACACLSKREERDSQEHRGENKVQIFERRS